MRKTVSIIIPAYNEQNFLPDCLDSVLDQTVDPAVLEVIVIDNASTDQTALAAKNKGVRVVVEPQKGYVHAVRKGVEVSQGVIMAFTDADCRVPTNWITKILENFGDEADILAVGGKLAFYDLNPILDQITRIILSRTATLPGGNMAVRRAALDRMGGIDPHVNLSLDYWITIQLRQIGKVKIDKSLVVMTSGRRFTGAFASQMKYPVNVISLQLLRRTLFFDFPDVRGKPG